MPDTITTCSRNIFRRGDRTLIGGHRAVVRIASDTTLTIAWRDAWYWRLAWWCEDRVAQIVRFFRSTEDADA